MILRNDKYLFKEPCAESMRRQSHFFANEDGFSKQSEERLKSRASDQQMFAALLIVEN